MDENQEKFLLEVTGKDLHFKKNLKLETAIRLIHAATLLERVDTSVEEAMGLIKELRNIEEKEKESEGSLLNKME